MNNALVTALRLAPLTAALALGWSAAEAAAPKEPAPVAPRFTAPTPVRVRADDPTKPAQVPNDYVITPFGYFHPSCVQYVDPSEQINTDGDIARADGTVRSVAPCAYPRYTADGARIDPNSNELANPPGTGVRPPEAYNGYLAYITALLTTPVDKMTAYLTVPPAPQTQSGQTVYLFPGLEDYQDVVSILQPVLGWDADGTSSDKFWSISPWNCCRRGTVYEGPSANVAAGDVLYGTMTFAAKDDTWTISFEDTSNSSIPVVTLASRDKQTFDWVFGSALETYGVTECSQLPAGSVYFTEIQVYVDRKLLADPPWTVNSGGTAGCTETSATIVSPTEQTINVGTP